MLALGKHGAGELNYSSDIDLVVFYDPQAQSLPDIYEAPKLYSRLAQGLVKLLSERTGHGYVHRVDYRLRPDPGSTPVAIALPSAYSYYETVGQNWERAAFIKARPIAGDLSLGADFLKDLAPFIWRKYFDFAAIADVHAMKRQIQAVRGHAEIAVAGHDIKLGRGGIREVEFFVQTQQLVFGGRRPDLRGRRTLDMLNRLHTDNWISEEARSELASAYRFLRTIEHRIQMVADEQTQRLPADEKALTDLAQFAGFKTLKAFSKALTDHARNVQKHYALLFEEGPELASEAGSLIFTGSEIDPETIATLERLGFSRSRARGRDGARLAFRAPLGHHQRPRTRSPHRTHTGPARRARRHRGSRWRAGAARRRLRQNAGGGRADDDPDQSRSPADTFRRSARHGAASGRDRGSAPACARCGDRPRLHRSRRGRGGHRRTGA